MNILIPYLHFIGIMLLTGALLSEYFILKRNVSAAQVNLLMKIDLVYGLAAALILITGLLRWFVVDAKGAAYFNGNPWFHIKLTLFVVIILLSLVPARSYRKWRKQVRQGTFSGLIDKEVKKPILFLRVEMVFLFLIPLLAVLVALGKGMS